MTGIKKIKSIVITVLMYLLTGITILLFLSNVFYISVIWPAKWLYSIFGSGLIIYVLFVVACSLLYPAIRLIRLIPDHKKTPIVLTALGGVVLLSVVGLFLYVSCVIRLTHMVECNLKMSHALIAIVFSMQYTDGWYCLLLCNTDLVARLYCHWHYYYK